MNVAKTKRHHAVAKTKRHHAVAKTKRHHADAITKRHHAAAIINLGCTKNQIDGERILAFLENHGIKITDDCANADVIVVNTCAFIKEAQEEAIEAILEMTSLRKNGKCKTLIVSGCFSQRYREKIKHEFPEVDIWAGVDDWETVLAQTLFERENIITPPPTDSAADTFFKRVLNEPIATQHIKIAEGCSHKCSFCVIPSIRGKFKSRTIDDIVGEAKWLYEQGARELILVAQDTTYYGKDIGTNLTALLKSLLKETKFPWLRMMYLHPQLVSDGLLDLIANESRLCSYFDIPLQHISDKILTAMNRRPLSADIYKLVDRIRAKIPNAALRTSFILGFPGETAREFRELLKFIEHARFDKVGVFPFSPEDGTPAAAIRPRVRTNVVQKRCEELMTMQSAISREILESKIGTVVPVIIDRISDDPDFNYEARTMHDAPEVDGRVFISNGNLEIGTINKIKIIGASDYDLFGEAG